jgi:pantoate--beta-alanine ligase
MRIISTLTEWQQLRQSLDLKLTVGFVPTMGNLHAGHASLLELARAQNDIVVLSIFVNPTQFNDPQDYQSYPRTHEADLALAEKLNVDYVFMPEKSSLYPDNYTYQVSETEISQYQEGAYRPGHFMGMLTVVLKLLLLVQAQRAYFGEKDHQQLQLIRGLVKAFFLNVDIVACPIVRESTGLALSSRNSLLTAVERTQAEHFAQIFQQITLPCADIIQQLTRAGIQVDYVEDRDNRRCAAVKVGRIRLIDNHSLDQV